MIAIKSKFINLKNSIKLIVIRRFVPALLNRLFSIAPRRKNTLLVVKCDGIGDYLLFRDYLYFLKASEKYKQHQIYLLANTGSKEIATYLDSKIIERFYWYSDGFFLKWDLVKLMFRLQKLRLETLLYSNYSRKYVVDELMKNINAKNKIAVDGDHINETAALKEKADSFYTHLIAANQVPLHEFERNRQIMEALTGEKFSAGAPFIDRANLHIVPNNSVIIFTGASSVEKKWPVLSFNELCVRLCAEFDTNIIVIGGNDDGPEVAAIGNGIAPFRFSCKTGVNIINLCEVIGGANLLISGDTVAIHIAAALGTHAICIAKGDLYGRFIPYPQQVSGVIRSVFPEGYTKDSKNYGLYSSYAVADVSVDSVYQAAREILRGQVNKI